MESPGISYYIYYQLIFDKSAKTISMGKEYSFQGMVLGPPDSYVQNNEVENLPHTICKN